VIFASGYEIPHESFGDVDAVLLVKPYCLTKLRDALVAALGKARGPEPVDGEANNNVRSR
jgi:hypothetical protein